MQIVCKKDTGGNLRLSNGLGEYAFAHIEIEGDQMLRKVLALIASTSLILLGTPAADAATKSPAPKFIKKPSSNMKNGGEGSAEHEASESAENEGAEHGMMKKSSKKKKKVKK